MKKICFYLAAAALLGVNAAVAQRMSPSDFLGYEAGDRFTYHHRVLDYVRYLAAENRDRVKLIEYGESYEGRPLMVAVLASPGHLNRLEEIRERHLAGIGLLQGEGGDNNRPAIAWLSYNVHGDEAVSSEVAMQVMYSLLGEDNRHLLEDLIVILDPCLNPDGHSRYVGWYNQVTGRRPDPSPLAREHAQPWPGGRYNHYLFDLNRDWAWQVQKESQQRLALYNRWMPHLHADFHEMGAGSTYYFPPAARPFHEDITSWQREFNRILGEYNRKYFDARHWLYFTRDSYDLFYPSYGDTWPSFNGAIGMTYEQGGGGRAGLALARPDMGDTLTLKARIEHHVAASKATLEALVVNKDRTIREFEAYFKKAKEQPVGQYRTYIVKQEGREIRLEALKALLEKQHIRFGRAGERFTEQATNLLSHKTEKTTFEAGDLLISAYQPKSHLLKVLFESNPVLEDSLTYDVTSWGLGYVFGLQVYGLEERKEPGNYSPSREAVPSPAAGTYGYLAGWETPAHLRFLSDLLTHKIRVRTSNSGFETGGRSFSPGTLAMMRAGNEALGGRFDRLVTDLAAKHGVTLFPVSTGMVTKGNDLGSGDVKILSPARVALAGGPGISPVAFGAVWHFIDDELGYPVTILERDHLDAQSLARFDVLILADGNYSSFLNEDRLSGLTDWVAGGGKLIVMEGALHAFAGKKGFSLKKRPEDKRGGADLLKPYDAGYRESLRYESAGGIYEVTLDTTHPIGYGYAGRPYYASVRSLYDLEYLPDGWNVGYLGADAYRAGFVGDKARPRLKNTLIIGVQEAGRGKIIYMADNPVFRGFWENGKLLFGNAVFR